MAIARCESVGKYRVTFTQLGMIDGKIVDAGPMKLQLPQHAFDLETRDGSPILDTQEPFEGELCADELTWLTGFPGKNFNFKWRFHVQPLKPRSARTPKRVAATAGKGSK